MHQTPAEVDACAFVGCGEASATQHLAATVDASYHLVSSDVVDLGVDPTLEVPSSLVVADFDGDARPLGSGYDIGADEAE